MRKDMAKLIVKGHSQPKDRSNSTKLKERDLENAPERGKMREGYDWRDGPRDHLNPLFNFLKSNVGRPWAKVYAEICAVADHRSFAGKHLREHIDREVLSEAELIVRMGRRWYYGGSRDFYYDSKGILRRLGNENQRRKSYWKDKQDPNKCFIDSRPYVRINGCWFEGEYFTIPTEKMEWQYVPGERKMQLLPKQYVRSVKQLNKKELKTLGLSNEPGWRWYD